jgi:hypothetical protein
MPNDNYRIRIDGRWTLVSLADFSKTYNQLYSFLYSLEFADELDRERLERAFMAYPWRGGYSAVNFYWNLYFLLPRAGRPVVKSITYSSPGILELALAVGVAMSLRRIVSNVLGAIRDGHSLYHDIYKGMQERKLLRIDVRRQELDLASRHIDFLSRSAHDLDDLMDLRLVDEIDELTDSKLATLKILLSVYRRARALKKYEDKGNIQL